MIGETSDFDESYSIETRQAFLQEQQEILDDTLHEIRKLNSQLKDTTKRLSSALSSIRNPTDQIESLNLDVFSITNLMSIRLDAYDLQVNPELNLDSGKRPIAIYKKVEKVYKCLRSAAQKRGINIRLNGASHNQFNATNAIEIAFFIIIDNAIKYSPTNKEISVNFYERDDTLILNVRNLGIRPAEHERSTLFHRSVRSKHVESIEGRGLGLYLLKQICDTNNIKIDLKIENKDLYFENGIAYAPFIVSMEFRNMIIPDENF
jgi:signal transduction histidine kinase